MDTRCSLTRPLSSQHPTESRIKTDRADGRAPRADEHLARVSASHPSGPLSRSCADACESEAREREWVSERRERLRAPSPSRSSLLFISSAETRNTHRKKNKKNPKYPPQPCGECNGRRHLTRLARTWSVVFGFTPALEKWRRGQAGSLRTAPRLATPNIRPPRRPACFTTAAWRWNTPGTCTWRWARR